MCGKRDASKFLLYPYSFRKQCDADQGMEGDAESLRDSLRAQDACSLMTIIYTKLLTRPFDVKDCFRYYRPSPRFGHSLLFLPNL